MNVYERNEGEGRSSRFSYHGDEPTEGGVQAVRTSATRESGARSAYSGHAVGVPGPDERLLDISELARTVGMHYTHRFAFPPGAEGELETVTPTVGTLRLTNAGEALLLNGSVSTTLRLECGRCLTPTDQTVEAEIEETFDLVSRNNAFNQEEVQAVDEDSPAAVISGNVLNVADLLRQNLLLAAPLQPLCREDCPGIEYAGGKLTTEEEEPSARVIADNPLHHLAEMLAAKRLQESAE